METLEVINKAGKKGLKAVAISHFIFLLLWVGLQRMSFCIVPTRSVYWEKRCNHNIPFKVMKRKHLNRNVIAIRLQELLQTVVRNGDIFFWSVILEFTNLLKLSPNSTLLFGSCPWGCYSILSPLIIAISHPLQETCVRLLGEGETVTKRRGDWHCSRNSLNCTHNSYYTVASCTVVM